MGNERIPTFCWDCKEWLPKGTMSKAAYPYICVPCMLKLKGRIALEKLYEDRGECPPKFAEPNAPDVRIKAKRKKKEKG